MSHHLVPTTSPRCRWRSGPSLCGTVRSYSEAAAAEQPPRHPRGQHRDRPSLCRRGGRQQPAHAHADALGQGECNAQGIASNDALDDALRECALCTKTIVSRLALKPCGQCDEELSCCSTCLRRHAAITLNDTPIGTTPRIFCPLCPPEPGRVRRLVTFDTLCRVLPPKELARCEEIGNSCTAFFCGGCHRQRHLNIDHKPAIMGRLRRANEAHLKASATAAKAPRDEGAPDPERLCWSHLKPSDDDTAAAASAASDAKPPPPSWESSALVTLERLKVGELNVSAAAESLIGTARDHGMVQGATLQQRLFDDVLPAIADPITRAALTHAVLRTLGDFRTPCCNRLHCFNCHVAGGHPGLTCDQFQAQRNAKQQGSGHTSDIDIVTCPKCFVSLVKGDGCMSVTAYGHALTSRGGSSSCARRRAPTLRDSSDSSQGLTNGRRGCSSRRRPLLAGDGGGGGEGGGAGGDLAQLAGEWLKLNAANIKRRMVRHFGRASSAVMLHSSTGRTAAIVQRVVAPSTHWPTKARCSPTTSSPMRSSTYSMADDPATSRSVTLGSCPTPW